MSKPIAISLLAMCASMAFGEQPKPITKPVDFALYAGVMATRTMDYVTTERLLTAGGHELMLPSGLVANKPAFAVFSIGSGIAEVYASRRLRVHHPKLARYVLMGDMITAGIVAGHNAAIMPKRVK